MFPRYIKTDRLTLQPAHTQLTPKQLYKYCSTENNDLTDVVETLKWEPHQTYLESASVLSSMRQQFLSAEGANYQISINDNFVGLCSMGFDTPKRKANFGIWLRKQYWGNKISQERAKALIEVGFTELDLKTIYVKVSAENEKSNKAVSRYITQVGGSKRGSLPNDYLASSGELKDLNIYAVTKKEFNKTFTQSDSVLEEVRW